MSLLADLSQPLESAPGYAHARAALAQGEDFTLAAPAGVRPLVTAALFRSDPRSTLVVVSGAEAADRFARQLAAYLPLDRVLTLPMPATLPWSRDPARPAVAGRRARALWALQEGRPVVVVASARSLMRRVAPRSAPETYEPVVLRTGSELDLVATSDRLALMGYERVDTADEPGRFAVRGGTLDVYPSDGHSPVRAELFGDEIESLRRYVPGTGQTVGDAVETEIYPCREMRLSNSVTKDIVHSYRSAFRDIKEKALADPWLAHDLELLEQGAYFNGVEAYMPNIYKELGSVTDYISKETLVVVAEPRALFDDTVRHLEEVDTAAHTAGFDATRFYLQPPQVDLGGRQRLTLVSLLRAGGTVDGELASRRPDVAGGESKTVAGLRGLLESGFRVVLAAHDRRQRETLTTSLSEAGLPVVTYAGAQHAEPGSTADIAVGLGDRVVHMAFADIPAGYVIPDARLAVVSVDDAFPRSGRRSPTADPTLLTFDFKPGDYVVHATHGIALFREVVRREVLGSPRDYLHLEYAKGDRLFVPVEQLDRVTKYVGPDASAPRVTRLNTADWSRATKKARAAARKLAFDLVDLYARRATTTGYAFSPDTPWQLEMEASFPFEETPDQISAIADVKTDMETDKPMDRLVCGDVGYGKTEVAIRAAFKATQDGKQVMILCPTTILAQQHFTTFSDRFEPYPVRVEVLSRFRTKSQQEAALAGFADGSVDILVGTHRLLSRDVSPQALGLIVVDEEQRFGVEHKEHLKNLREQVDVLAMSATPIPRTLQMALSGVREMSVIDTPPPNRFPVKVHVGEFDHDLVQAAIRLELERGGQVYYVFNRVMTIDEASARVREMVPEARIRVAHGQMSDNQLERVMESFAAGQVDVLVATTIIESGIDNPHTNTLIIEDAERLGLAQLYQLKGRVGRSHVRAFAYFLVGRGKALTEQAVERLTAMRELTELGSGIKIALKDLEIRGAGSLLGAEQSGNLSAVGFDLYADMLREAVAEVRGEALPAHTDVRVDVPAAAFLAEEYVPEVDERVRYYRRLAAAVTPEAAIAIGVELTGRYGAMPEAASNLVGVARARAIAGELGITHVAITRGRVAVSPITLSAEERGQLAPRGAVYFEKDRRLQMPLAYGESVVGAVLGVLDAILSLASTDPV
ncbi:MAG: transcription-repair coupling factor [Coriobacteriia bacterium]|nr:transcription-repair coupling factor [Coriobacteriia bacterium]